MTSDQIDLSIVIPLYNEEESLRELHAQIRAALQDFSLRYEFIFVDDGSTDGSMSELTRLHENDRAIRVFQFRKNYGKSAALAQGFSLARGEIIVTMDADLQDDPKEIPQLIEVINSGYDLVSGWKRHRKDPFIKCYTSKIFNWVTCRTTGLTLHDINCGLKAYRREVTESIDVYGQMHRFLPVLAHWQGFKVTESVVKHHPRKYGNSKFGVSRFTAGIFDLITVLFITRYTKRPLHLFGLVGMFAFVLGFGISGWLAIERLFFNAYLSSRPILFLGILLIVVGVQFVSIGLLGEMITHGRKGAMDYAIKKSLE